MDLTSFLITLLTSAGASIVLSSALILSSSVSFAQSSFGKEMQMMKDGEKQKAFIEKVAQQAKEKDTASILSEMEPSMLKAIGEARIVDSLQSTVFPFFSTYVKLHNYEQITNAGLPDGRSGLWHYTYITTTTMVDPSVKTVMQRV